MTLHLFILSKQIYNENFIYWFLCKSDCKSESVLEIQYLLNLNKLLQQSHSSPMENMIPQESFQ